jgi:hypothetical protein
VQRRRSNPTNPVPPDAVHATRRTGGSRRDATERVVLTVAALTTHGWTLNVSRGGARLVVEESVEPEARGVVEFVGTDGTREVRVVWVQDESDGQIVGVQFLDADGSVPPPPSGPGRPPPGK